MEIVLEEMLGYELNQTPLDNDHRLLNSAVSTNIDIAAATYASSTTNVLELNIFRSGIDPKFCVFSYKHPDLSSTEISNNTFATFILHNYTPTISNFDETFLGSMTFIGGGPSSGEPYLVFTTYFGAQSNYSNGYYKVEWHLQVIKLVVPMPILIIINEITTTLRHIIMN